MNHPENSSAISFSGVVLVDLRIKHFEDYLKGRFFPSLMDVV